MIIFPIQLFVLGQDPLPHLALYRAKFPFSVRLRFKQWVGNKGNIWWIDFPTSFLMPIISNPGWLAWFLTRYQFKTMNMSTTTAPQYMTSSSEVLENLRRKKMDNEFRWTPEGFRAGKGRTYQPDEMEIIKIFRFEGASDPSDSEILYLIETNDGFIGYSMNSYGAGSSHADEEGYDNFIRQVPNRGHGDQLLFEL
jgi:hypothetical protein